MSAATPTGAELRARREALGLSPAEAAMLPAFDGDYNVGDIQSMELYTDAARLAYNWNVGSVLYAAALDAEEKRRVGSQVEPVPPEGVTVHRADVECVSLTAVVPVAGVEACTIVAENVELTRYALARWDYEQRQHAASDRQRKLDAVRAAEDAYNRAWQAHRNACEALTTARAHADDTLEVADGYKVALAAARKEAGLA